MPSSPEKIIVLITGANTGIGYETAANLLRHSSKYHILLGSRDPAKGSLAARTLSSLPSILGTVSPLQIDVTSDLSVDVAARLVQEKYGYLDILINNAGCFATDALKRNAFRKILEVNTIGALSVTEAFLPLLRKGKEKRIVFVSSSTGSISQAADPKSKYYSSRGTEYRASKAAVNMLIVQYYAALKGDGFLVFGADPGLCATGLFQTPQALRDRGAVEADIGGERVACVARGERDADVGMVCGEYGVCPW